MDMEQNKHCTETQWSMRYHYRDNSSCGVNDNPNRIVLKPKSLGYPLLDFECPRQKHELEKVDTMMQYAYERGRLDNRQELSKLLKQLISL